MASRSDVINSTIGLGSSFEGKFFISGALRIDGKFEGEIKTDDELTIGPAGKVKTNIFAKSIVVAGTVVGNLKAEEEVRLLETGKVLGDIHAPVVIMSRGVLVQGNVIITGGSSKDIKKLIEDSYIGSSGKSGDSLGKSSDLPKK
jgi:cytoskeletal protein CcmA (bactofilin family)